MYKWQINKQNNVNFTVERIAFGCFWLLWLWYGLQLCHLGFGEDTDAWLMAQTAQKLSLGQSYDPARSFGNPLYELLLVLIQPNQNWFWSNLFNLFLASVFLWRLGKYFINLSEIQLFIARTSLMALPIFTEAATSSMEYMLAWLLLLEAMVVHKNGHAWLFWFIAFAAVFNRLEFLALIIPLIFYKNESIISPNPFYLLLFITSLFLFWSFGKNPSPFSTLEGLVHFYGGRLFFLFKQAGVLVLVYLLLIASNIFFQNEQTIYQKTGIVAGIFFILFPFEWAYGFPALLFGLISWISIAYRPYKLALPMVVLLLSCIRIQANCFLDLPSNFGNRKEMTRTFKLAQEVDFKNPTLILEGATYFPTDTRKWEKLMDNRLFHRKNSNFYVGEKLSENELDSLKKSGMVIKKSL